MTAVFCKTALEANATADAALHAELFELYFDHAPSNLAMMRAALEGGEEDGWRAGAHALKGAARTLGFLALGELAAAAEDVAPSAARLEEIDAALERARRAADAYRAED